METKQSQVPDTATAPSVQSATTLKPPFWVRAPVIVLGTVVLAGAFLLGMRYLVETFTHETTDDAFLDAHIVSLAPPVAGRVSRVNVTDNQAVEAGQVLLELDPRDLEIQLNQKQAATRAAEANVELIKSSVDLFRTQIATAEATAKQSAAEAGASEATAKRANADLKRGQELMANHTISAQEFDTLKAIAEAAEANLRAAQEKAVSDQSKIAQSQAQLQAGIKGFERAQAQTRESELDAQAAELNLSYARVICPSAGIVTKKAVVAGDYVQVGQSLMALVPRQLFVTANFKETQLANIQTNQPVKVTIDAIRGRTFYAHVESIMSGSGARFSLLPPENAVGNYVKVVQRVPVKIVFNQPLEMGQVLGPGMSVVPLVRVASTEIPEWCIVLAAVVLALMVGALWWRLGARR
jgi:membrane fusion protein (multidrug efflux system)